MKTFEVEGWYRYNGGDEKDYEIETIVALTPECAIISFLKMFEVIRFFKIDIKEIV